MTETLGAIIVAAGSGERMGGLDKLFTEVAGKPLLAHAIEPFQECLLVSGIVLVVTDDNLQHGRDLVTRFAFSKVGSVVEGGARRQDSVRAGIDALSACDYVAVHDGGRPLIRPGMIARGLNAARETGASVPVIPLVDTIKNVAPDGVVSGTLDRSRLVAAQTPQVFRYDLLMRAHTEITHDVTDDSAMVELLGVAVMTYEGRRRNIKITTPDDLWLAESYLQ